MKSSDRGLRIRKQIGPEQLQYLTRIHYLAASDGEWGEAFPNRLLGAATLDRLRHNAHRVVLDGDSYRAPRPRPKAGKSTVAKTPKSGNP